MVKPKAGGAAIQGAPAGRKPHRPSSPRGREEDKIQVLKVQKGGLTLPQGSRRGSMTGMTSGERQSLCWQERGEWSSRG